MKRQALLLVLALGFGLLMLVAHRTETVKSADVVIDLGRLKEAQT